MRVTDLATAAYAACIENQQELHQAWITQSFKLAEIAGMAHLPTIQANNRLDLLIRMLESEWEQPSDDVVDFSLELMISLSECWVLRAYEVVRAAAEQLGRKSATNKRLANLKHSLCVVRMPLAKAEIQQAKKATTQIVLVHEDGMGAKEYTSDGTYVMARQLCADTGSAIWCPVDITTGQSAQIRRIDLSNELMALFD